MTVKPVDLCRHLIRIFSAAGDTVLDPFIGTGTTAVAALDENRRCIGYEIDRRMMPVIRGRIGGAPALNRHAAPPPPLRDA